MENAAAMFLASLDVEDAANRLVRKIIGPLIDQIEYDDEREPQRYQIRNLILVIVTVIAAMTFQAGINPPGGLWQDNQKEHVAGSAIFAYQKQAAFYVFLFFNTMAFTTSAFIIFCFTQRFPLGLEIRMAIVFVVVTYACAVSAIIPSESANLAYILLVALLPIVVLSLIRWCIRQQQQAAQGQQQAAQGQQQAVQGQQAAQGQQQAAQGQQQAAEGQQQAAEGQQQAAEGEQLNRESRTGPQMTQG